MATEVLTLYAAKICPYAHRAELALTLAQANFKRFEIDLYDKPDWYAPKINPAGKVPTITYGGPDVAPDDPSPESIKIAESLVLVEFVADLFPKAGIFPSDPVQRAQARFFIDQADTNFAGAYAAHLMKGAPATDLLAAVEAIQALLPAGQPFALGTRLTAADIAIAPFVLRTEVLLSVRDTEGVWKTLQEPKYVRFWKYYQDLKAHPSVTSTWDEDLLRAVFVERLVGQK